MSDNMLIKVCGLREKENIREVIALGVDMIGFTFYPGNPRYVKMISANAGIIPDYSRERFEKLRRAGKARQDMDEEVRNKTVQKAGVFVDDMPQTIISRIYNYNLQYVQLNGDESSIMIDNLKRSVVPDIQKDLKIIKRITVSGKDELEKSLGYEGHADLLLFYMKSVNGSKKPSLDILEGYKGDVPFLLGYDFDIEDAEVIRKFSHKMFAGIDINDCFETETGMKDVERLGAFIRETRK